MATENEEFVALAELEQLTSALREEQKTVLVEPARPEWLDRMKKSAIDAKQKTERPDLRSEDSTPPIFLGMDAGQLVLISIVGLAIWGAMK